MRIHAFAAALGSAAEHARVLMRVSGKVKPSLAKKVEAALTGL